jgi:hypothetical protein
MAPRTVMAFPAQSAVLLITTQEICRECAAKSPSQMRSVSNPSALQIIVEASSTGSAMPHPFAVRLRFISPAKYWKGGANPTKSLCKAQFEVRSRFPDPRFWSALELAAVGID